MRQPYFQDFVYETGNPSDTVLEALMDIRNETGPHPVLPLQLPGGDLRILRHGHQRRHSTWPAGLDLKSLGVVSDVIMSPCPTWRSRKIWLWTWIPSGRLSTRSTLISLIRRRLRKPDKDRGKGDGKDLSVRQLHFVRVLLWGLSGGIAG